MQSRAKMHHVAVLIGNFVTSEFPNVFCTCSSTLVDKFGFMLGSQRQPISHVNYLPSTWTASGLPMLGHWDFETRGVLRKTMRSVVLSFTSNGNPSNPALLVLSHTNALGKLGNAIGDPMLSLDSPGNGHRIVEPFATSLLLPTHLGNAMGRPTPGLGSPGV